MLSARWAHRTLVGVCIFVALAVGLYAGWEGWLGEPIQAWIQGWLNPLLARIPRPELLEQLARVLGAIATLMTAAFGVYKGIYYADRNLPERLTQLLSRTDQRLVGDRQPLLAAVTENRPASRVRESVFYVGPLNRALRAMQFGDHPAADMSLREALRDIEGQMEVSAKQRCNFEEQKVAAHILRGSIASARAEYNAQDGKSPDADRALAEQEFTLALDLRPKDLDALELRGRQRQALGNFAGALSDYSSLAEAALSANTILRAARAHRLSGELKEALGTARDLTQARVYLADALASISVAGTLDRAGWLEKGKILYAVGSVQAKQGRTVGPKKHLRQAIDSCKRAGLLGAQVQADAERLLLTLPPDKPNPKPPTDKAPQPWWKRLFRLDPPDPA